MKNTKLELQWPNKDKALYFDVSSGEYEWVDRKDPRVSEPRILVEKQQYGDKDTENLLIKGDNLLALKALLQDFQRKIKLIYIDPPYNTGNAFAQYDDGLEHSIWLGLMKTRIEALYKLLSPNGSMWISIDDDECHYLKVMCDEIFGRHNFVCSVVWQKKYAAANDARGIPDAHDYILVYQKSASFSRNLLPRSSKQDSLYKYDSNDGKGLWRSDNLSVKTYSKAYDYPITNPLTEASYNPPKGRAWLTNKENMARWIEDGRVFFGQSGKGAPQLKRYLNEVQGGVVATTWWTHEDAGHNDESRKESKVLFGEEPFSTPKPERLLQRIITLSSNEGDWVLDSFAGSGTTPAVAHKMGRKWIAIELGNHAETHIIPRMEKVLSGKDKGGITDTVDWKGGGGFKYFELGDSLFVRDEELRFTVINPKMYNGSLIRAVLKVEGFKLFNPDNGLHGLSGTTAAHVTEQYLSQDYVDTLVNEINDQAKFIVIYAKTVSSKLKLPDNVEVKRIPDILLKKFTV
ncbi:MAG: site-specific DNA-methyltransferase [Candidatus Pacebacteria bacterium]|nr:site-specific DNA-methyltransferase [Candidatus Paceibacterota bacterium]